MDTNTHQFYAPGDSKVAARLPQRLRRSAIAGILLTSLLIGSIATVLLYRANIERLHEELRTHLQLTTNALESEVARLANNVAQITSRTRIRQELARYNDYIVDQQQLIDYTTPKLQDVLLFTPEIKAISRLSNDGKVLVEVGPKIDPKNWPPILQQPQLPGQVFRAQGSPQLVVGAPILDRGGNQLGIDLVQFDVRPIEQLLANFAADHPGRIELVPLFPATESAQSFLELGELPPGLDSPHSVSDGQPLSAGQMLPRVSHFEDALVSTQRIRNTSWLVRHTTSPSLVYLPARRHAGYLALVFVALTLAALLVTYFLMRRVEARIQLDRHSLIRLSRRNRHLLNRARESESQLQAIIDNAPAVIYVKNLDGSYRLVNSAFEKVTGIKREQIIGRTDHDIFPKQAADLFRGNDLQVINASGPMTIDEQLLQYDGDHDYLSVKFPLLGENGQAYLLCGISTDITQRKQHERKLRQLAAVFENSADAIMVTDEHARIININPAFSSILGYRLNEVSGRDISMLKAQRRDAQAFDSMWQEVRERGAWRGEIWSQSKAGRIVPAVVSVTCLRDEQRQVSNYIALFSDLSAIKDSEQQLIQMAHHDALTGLPNRLWFRANLERAITQAKRKGQRLGLIFVDLDQFKNVNDSLGHETGDQMLIDVAHLLREAAREGDTVARIGGDEFVLLLEDITDKSAPELVVSNILQALDRPFEVSQHSIRLTASLGVSLYPEHGEDSSLLMRNADAAMYSAKAEGRNTWRFYAAHLTDQAFEHLQMQTWLREALANNEIHLEYQPQIDLRDGSLQGLEALARWTRPDGTRIPPDRFILLAEGSDLIHPLGRLILEQACRQAREWIDLGVNFGRLAINISGRQLQAGNLIEILDELLHRYGLPEHYLELELTETFLMCEMRGAIDRLHQLRARGFSLTIDDFGTGYSSLAYLKALPVQRLKIDRSFICDIPADSNDKAITSSVVALGRSMQLEVLGEGIETHAQLEFLRAEGCALGQGYLFSRPMKADATTRYLREFSITAGVAERESSEVL